MLLTNTVALSKHIVYQLRTGYDTVKVHCYVYLQNQVTVAFLSFRECSFQKSLFLNTMFSEARKSHCIPVLATSICTGQALLFGCIIAQVIVNYPEDCSC